MAIKFLEPGGDADFGVALWAGVNGTPAVATDFVHGTHVKSIKYATGGVGDTVNSVDGVLADAGGRISWWVYLNALPNATSTILQASTTGFGGTVFRLRMTSAGTLQLVSGVQLGSDGATLATGQYYRISIAWTITSTSVNEFRIFVNGVSSISVTNGTLANNAVAVFAIGNWSANATLDMRSSDHYVDDSSALTDPGNIWVTAKRPNANGTTNGFTTQIGAGGSGYGSGHSPQVNERPQSDTNGWSMIGAGSAVTEEYAIEGKATGDIAIGASDTIVDFMGWVRAKALASETASIVVAGATSNISLTSTIAYFLKVAGSSTYPGGGTDIGIITSTTVTTVSLYECGIIVAYIPGAAGVFTKNINQNQAVKRASFY